MLKTLIVIVLSAASAYLISFFPLLHLARQPTIQPIQFNHKIHIAGEEMACKECHIHVEDGAVAGRPRLKGCMECHESEASENPEEHKIREFQGDIPWKRLYQLPEHVYFSHRLHVTVAEINCEVCHGAMAHQEKPPSEALKKLTMTECIGCHDEEKASRDCMACHR